MNFRAIHISNKSIYSCLKAKDMAKEICKYRDLMKRIYIVLLIWLLLGGCELLFPTNATFRGEKYAVVVGINDYIHNEGNSIGDLEFCVADAKAMEAMLTDAGWNVELIKAESGESDNDKATKDDIERALQEAPTDLTTFLFYFSGHGYGGINQAYIVPSDADLSSYSKMISSMISATEFSDWLNNINATNKLVILDSCYSGGFANPGDCIDAAPGNIASDQISTNIEMLFRFGELLAQNSASATKYPSAAPLVISAAGWNEESWEYSSNDGGYGIFTHYFLQAAETSQYGSMNGDFDSDGILSCIEAYNYAEKAIEKDNRANQLPHISGGLRDFALIDSR